MGTELIMGMGEVINYLKELEAENKKLKASSSGKYMEQISALNKQAITLRHNWKEEVDRLEEEREIMSKVIEGMKQENNKLKEENKEWKASDKHLNKCIDTIRDQYLEQKEENKKLKIPDGVVRAFKFLVVNWWEDEEKYYRENFDMKEKYDDEPGNIPTKYLSDCNYTDLRILDDWIVGGKYEKYEIEESEEEDSESEEDSDEESD